MEFVYSKEKNWPRAHVEHRFTIQVPFNQDEEERTVSADQVSAMLDVWEKLRDGELTPKELRAKL